METYSNEHSRDGDAAQHKFDSQAKNWEKQCNGLRRKNTALSVCTAATSIMAVAAFIWAVGVGQNSAVSNAAAARPGSTNSGGMLGGPPGAGGQTGTVPNGSSGIVDRLFNSDGNVNTDALNFLIKNAPPGVDSQNIVTMLMQNNTITAVQAAKLSEALKKFTPQPTTSQGTP